MRVLKLLLAWLTARLRRRRIKSARTWLRVNEPPRADHRSSIEAFRRIQHERQR